MLKKKPPFSEKSQRYIRLVYYEMILVYEEFGKDNFNIFTIRMKFNIYVDELMYTKR